MTGARLLVLALAMGLLAGAAAPADAQQAQPDRGGPAADDAQALSLLAGAVRAAERRPWSGFQQVTSWQSGTASSTLLAVTHDPATGRAAEQAPTGGSVALPAAPPAARLVNLLTGPYDLVLAPGSSRTDVVEVRRPGVPGAAGVAGRFWIDRRSGLVLRRDVVDAAGRVVRRTALVALDVAPAVPPRSLVVAVAQQRPELQPAGRPVTGAELAGLHISAPTELPDGMQLFEARRHDDGVLQLAYSDGLSTMSLFVQNGAVPRAGDGRRDGSQQAAAVTWAAGADPWQVAWEGSGRTWTLVSDAPVGTVQAALRVLPHGSTSTGHDRLAARAWRGLSRVGSWLNPFD